MEGTMSTIKDGGKAFPSGSYDKGMSLRDWFAGQALVGLLSGQFAEWSRDNFSALPVEAYGIADAMLAAREGRS
jgi:hypothetical protein